MTSHRATWLLRGTALVTGTIVVILLLLGGTMRVVMHHDPWADPHGVAPVRASGTVIGIRHERIELAMVVRHRAMSLAEVIVTAAHPVVAWDGSLLPAADVRLGDVMAIDRGGTMTDLSQEWVVLTGIVGSPPEPDGGPMTIQTTSGSVRDIVVDLGPGTSIGGLPSSRTSRAGIVEAEQIRIYGVLDRTLGEVTQADAVVRLGP